MRTNFVIGSRGSELAMWQANFVQSLLETEFPDCSFEIRIIKTTGDEVADTVLSKIGDKGLFTRQIEAELLKGDIDFAVHSLKDLQTVQPDGLVIGVCEREKANDVLVSRSGEGIGELRTGARVATGSLRRKSQLLAHRPDLTIEEIRGNVPTRLRKFDESNLDGLILAFAGIHRLGLDARIGELLTYDVMLPAVGQGAVAIEIREDDGDAVMLVAKLDHLPTRICTTAERSFLRRLEGGCQVPIGGFAELEGDVVKLEGMVGSLDGSSIVRERVDGRVEDAEKLGSRLAELLIERGRPDTRGCTGRNFHGGQDGFVRRRPMVLSVRKDDKFSRLLRSRDLEVLNIELTGTDPVTDMAELRKRLAVLDEYDGLFFTSPVAVTVFLQEVLPTRRSFNGKTYALGQRAGRMLADAGYAVSHRDSANTAEELIGMLDEKEFAGKKFLFVRGDRSLNTIPDLLGDRADVDKVTVYRTKKLNPAGHVRERIQEMIVKNEIDWICFFSPSGVESFCSTFERIDPMAFKAAAIGKTTAKSARDAGFAVEFVSERADADVFANGLIQHINSFE